MIRMATINYSNPKLQLQRYAKKRNIKERESVSRKAQDRLT
jgi:hypothetical protein